MVCCDKAFDAGLCSCPGVVHGGVVARAADDLMANLLLMEYEVLTFATTLRTRFVRPVLVGTRHRLTARLIGRWSDGFRAEADVSVADGELCAVVAGSYVAIRPEHVGSLLAIDRHERNRLEWYLARKR